MLGTFLAAIEATAVAAAVPTAVGELGGMARYSWVFSAYLLTSTTTLPLYGKLADLFGRRRVYHVAVALFLLGSALSGAASSLHQLILFRAIQGLGAGGVQPIGMILIGDIFTLEERARMQGLFSGVWGVASLLGPLLGGLITDALSWRWIFYLNIPFGLASSLVLQRYLRETHAETRHERRLDVLGTVLLTSAITLLLVAVLEGAGSWGLGAPRTLALFAAAGGGLALFVWQERRAAEPMLPLDLFRDRAIAVSSAGNLALGALLFSLTAFVPMYSQAVLGGTAVAAGALLTPMLIGWPISSFFAGRLLLRVGYRRLTRLGGVLAVAGGLLLCRIGPATNRSDIIVATFVIGLSLGFQALPYLLAVQNAVPWQRRGVATSTVLLFRAAGGSIAVAALGALLNARVQQIAGAGVDPNAALDPVLRARLSAAALHTITSGLLAGLQSVFRAMLALAVLCLAAAFLFPRGLPRMLAPLPEEAPDTPGALEVQSTAARP